MLFSVNPLVIILPLFLVQYMLAIFTLTRLALARLPIKYYVVWNISILLVFFVGSIAFLIYYYGKRKPVADKIIADEDARAAAAKKDQSAETPQENGGGPAPVQDASPSDRDEDKPSEDGKEA